MIADLKGQVGLSEEHTVAFDKALRKANPIYESYRAKGSIAQLQLRELKVSLSFV